MASSTDTDTPSTLDVPASLSLNMCPSTDQNSGRNLGHNAKQSRSSHPPGVVHPASLDDVDQNTTITVHKGTSGYELLIIRVTTAGVVVSIQVQLLTSNSMASPIIPRIFLTLGMMSELVGVMLIVSFIRFPANHRYQSSHPKTIRAVSEIPTFLILLGIIGVTAALVAETIHVSVGTAVAMSGVLFLGVLLCLLALSLGLGEPRRGIRHEAA